MMRLGIVGWRGMVGSVLLDRMKQCNDFDHFEVTLFSSTLAGQKAPHLKNTHETIVSADDIEAIMPLDIVISCQGAHYTHDMHAKLRSHGFRGFYIDASSALRMKTGVPLVLDPVNGPNLEQAIAQGVRDFAGANCTVSLMLMAVGGLCKLDFVENVTFMSYQAASGAGAAAMEELLLQQAFFQQYGQGGSILEQAELLKDAVARPSFPKSIIGWPLALNILPFIDGETEYGQSREEWKSGVEAHKILLGKTPIAMDGTCVRVPTLRAHAQGLMIKMRHDLGLSEINDILKNQHQWIRVVDNTKEATLAKLTPQAVSGTLDIAVGRVRKSLLGTHYLNVFTVGDQLLWGAAEPLRRMLSIIREF